MNADSCDLVGRYLDSFLDQSARAAFDLNGIGDHVSICPRCNERFQRFFRTIQLPEAKYLRETMDELALALFNLGKAIIRDRPPVNEQDVTENIVITEQGGGSVSENVEAGTEMIDDAEDYSGSSRVAGADLEELRDVLQAAESSRQMRLDLALQIFKRVTPLDSRYENEAWNWLGVLHCQKEEFEEARQAFQNVLADKGGATNVRAWSHCGLTYVYKNLGDLDQAVKSARRAIILAEEDGKDTYFGQFAAQYVLLLRAGSGDLAAAEELIEGLLDRDRERFHRDLRLPSNKPVLEALAASPLSKRFAGLLE